MNCEEARRHWSLYHDSEADAETCFEISEHLAGCVGCAQWFHGQSHLEDKIEDKLRAASSLEPSAELWSKVLVGSGVQPARTTRHWTVLGGMLALAASVLVMAFFWNPSGAETANLTQITAEYHTRLASLMEPVEYESRSDLEVEDYLRGRVNFPVRCPPRRDSGFLVRGAGTCQLDSSEAAYLVGEVDGSDVSIFILPSHALARFPRQARELADGAVHHCREGAYQMVMAEIDQSVVLIIGKTDQRRLGHVLHAYGSYHEHV